MNGAALPVAVLVRLHLIEVGISRDRLIHAVFLAYGQGRGNAGNSHS
jgi:hypothetical protein